MIAINLQIVKYVLFATRWTWAWVNSGSWWWTGRPGMLQFMGSQRVGHDWATELNWTDSITGTPVHRIVLKRHYSEAPWWLSNKEFACHCRRHGFDPWSRKILHVMGKLSPWATTTEPVLWSPGTTSTEPTPRACAPQEEKPLQWEAHTPQRKE